MKTAIFAGLGRLGIPVAQDLLDKGFHLAISYRNSHTSQQNVNNLINTNGPDRVTGIDAELTNLSQAQNFIKTAISHLGKVDALINIASAYPNEINDFQRWQSGSPVTDEDWSWYDSNFTLIRNVILSLLQQLDNPSPLSIINFTDARPLLYFDENILDPYTSQGGILKTTTKQIKKTGLDRLAKLAPPRHTNPYTLAKLDLTHLTRKLALDLGPKNIRVNAIAPGPMIPPPDTDAAAVDTIAAQTALNRWGKTNPIVNAVNYLLQDDYTTGQTIKTDGGLYLKQKFKKLIG